jgi:hypothetical protein
MMIKTSRKVDRPISPQTYQTLMSDIQKTIPTTPLKRCSFCPIHKGPFRNLELHILKTHKLFRCVHCGKYKPLSEAINNIGDKGIGKYSNKAMCEECWT